MTRTRSFVFLLLFLSIAPALHAQWETTNGPAGDVITGLTAIGTTIVAGNNNGVFQWVGDSVWGPASLSGVAVQALFANGPYLLAGTVEGICYTSNFGVNWVIDTFGMGAQYVFSFAISGPNFVTGTDNGVFISSNGGVSWRSASDSVDDIYALASSGSNLVAGSEGILLSTDNGATWNETNNALTGTDVRSLAVSGNDLFAGTEDLGAFLSTDNGETWNAVNNGLTDSTVYAIEVIGSQLFLGTDSGVFLSTNNGGSWLEVNDSLTEYFTGVYSFATDGTYLYAGTGAGVWKRALTEFNGVSDGVIQPTAEKTLSVYPNPFSQSTNIRFTSPQSEDARITIVNILGAEVAQVFSGELESGEHSFVWDNPTGLPAGMYECLIQIGGQMQQVPIILTH